MSPLSSIYDTLLHRGLFRILCVGVFRVSENEFRLLISPRKSQFNSIEGVMFRWIEKKYRRKEFVFLVFGVTADAPLFMLEIGFLRLPVTCQSIMPCEWMLGSLKKRVCKKEISINSCVLETLAQAMRCQKSKSTTSTSARSSYDCTACRRQCTENIFCNKEQEINVKYEVNIHQFALTFSERQRPESRQLDVDICNCKNITARNFVKWIKTFAIFLSQM